MKILKIRGSFQARDLLVTVICGFLLVGCNGPHPRVSNDKSFTQKIAGNKRSSRAHGGTDSGSNQQSGAGNSQKAREQIDAPAQALLRQVGKAYEDLSDAELDGAI